MAALLSSLLVVGGQHLLDPVPTDTACPYLDCSFVSRPAWSVPGSFDGVGEAPNQPRHCPRPTPRFPWLIVSHGETALAFARAGGNQFRLPGMVAWAVAVVARFAARWFESVRLSLNSVRQPFPVGWRHLLAISVLGGSGSPFATGTLTLPALCLPGKSRWGDGLGVPRPAGHLKADVARC